MKLDFEPRKNITAIDRIRIAFEDIIGFNNIIALPVLKKICKNWYMVALFKIGLINEFRLFLRDGNSIKINKSNFISLWSYAPVIKLVLKNAAESTHKIKNVEINNINKIIEFKFGDKLLRFRYDSQKQLANTIGMIKDQFIDGQYRWLDIKNKTVLDIGANIGDTAIYFTLKGAKHVYAFEPYPYSYNLALKNIRLNELQYRVTLLNEGCGGRKGKIKIKANYKNLGGTDLKNFKNGTNIGITTLGEIVKRFGIIDNAILKLDCEGCEYGVLLEAQNSDLRRFKQMQIEYHYGYLNLKKKLEGAGFKVNKTFPKLYKNLNSENEEMLIGMIYAERNT